MKPKYALALFLLILFTYINSQFIMDYLKKEEPNNGVPVNVELAPNETSLSKVVFLFEDENIKYYTTEKHLKDAKLPNWELRIFYEEKNPQQTEQQTFDEDKDKIRETEETNKNVWAVAIDVKYNAGNMTVSPLRNFVYNRTGQIIMYNENTNKKVFNLQEEPEIKILVEQINNYLKK